MKTILLLIMTLTATIAFGWNIPPADKEEAYLYYKNKTINPGFENGTTNFTASGGSFTVTTTAADVGEGARAGVFNASAASQTLSGTNYTIEKGLLGANAYAKCTFRTTATDYKIQVHDGTNVISEAVIAPSTQFIEQGVNFVFPSSGTARLRILSASDSSDLFIDDCYLGRAPNVAAMSLNSFYGGIRYAGVASCTWSLTNTGGFVDFGTDDDCTGRVLSGNASGPADSAGNRKPSVTFSYLPPGNYMVVATGNILLSNTSGALAFNAVRLSDGTSTYSPPAAMNLPTGDTTRGTVQNVVWNITYNSPQTSKTFILQANSSASGGVDVQTTNANQDFEIKVYRFPLASDVAYRVDTIASSWSGFHDSTCNWTSSSGSYVTPSADASCGFTERTNTNFGTVSSTGSKTPGITFTPIRAGKYRVCANTQLLNDTTLSYARVRMNDGTNTLGEATARAATGGVGQTVTICGILPVASISTVSLNLQINASGNTTQLGAYDSGIAAIDWTINAIDQQVPAPVVIGSISTNSTGVERIERAAVTSTCSTGTCTIASQSGSWLTSITRDGTGDYNLNIASGMFTAAPVCFCQSQGNVAAICYGFDNPSTSLWQFRTLTSGGSASDAQFSIQCMGPR